MKKNLLCHAGLFLVVMTLLLSAGVCIAATDDMYVIRGSGKISRTDANMVTLNQVTGLGDVNDAAFNGKTGELIVLHGGATISQYSANLTWIGNTPAPGVLNKVAINNVTGDIYVAYEDASTNASIMRYDENMNPLGVQEAINCDMITAMAVNPTNGDVVVARSHPNYLIGYLSAYDSELYYHYDYGNTTPFEEVNIPDIAINSLGTILVNRGTGAVAKFLSDLTWVGNGTYDGVVGLAAHPTSNDFYICRSPGLSRVGDDMYWYGNTPFWAPPTTGVAVNSDGNVILYRESFLSKLTADMQTKFGNSESFGLVKKVVVISGWAGPQCGDADHPYPVADLSGPDGDKDCIVDMYDFAVLAQSWLLCENPQSCD